MIRECSIDDFEAILSIINEAAEVYRDIIPTDLWREPYMSTDELRKEISSDIRFFGSEVGGSLVAVMGTQSVKDATLIRHAYVRTNRQRKGEGGRLLQCMLDNAPKPVLIGTWKAARRALRFYEKHGFRLIEGGEKDRLLRAYWNIPALQIKSSVIMADHRALQELVKSHGITSSEMLDFDAMYKSRDTVSRRL